MKSFKCNDGTILTKDALYNWFEIQQIIGNNNDLSTDFNTWIKKSLSQGIIKEIHGLKIHIQRWRLFIKQSRTIWCNFESL